MLDKATRILSENLVRAIDRRDFLKRTGETVFAGVITLAAGHTLAPTALAGAQRPAPPAVPRCAPPGPYCNLDGNNSDPNGCHGGSCFQHRINGQVEQCRVYYSFYQAGCWTTADAGGYWTCCDCECGTPRLSSCGCAQFSMTPSPRPDRTSSGAVS